MRKLIIGCGYLGRRVARAWLQRGDDVYALTRSARNAAELRDFGVQPIVGDVTNPGALTGLPQAETVLYAVGYDRNAGPDKRTVYVDGLENVLNRIAGRVSRFLHVSSTSVYGQTDGERVDETSICQPLRENGRICRDAEQLVWRFFRPATAGQVTVASDGSSTSDLAFRGTSDKVPHADNSRPDCSSDTPSQREPDRASRQSPSATVLRLAGIYGPGRLLSRIESLKSGASLPGNPEAWLNLIHVDDAVQAVLACEMAPSTAGKTYLVCDDRPVRRREYYAALARHVTAPTPQFAEDEHADVRGFNKRCCNRRLREELGVELQYPTIEAGLPHAVNDVDA